MNIRSIILLIICFIFGNDAYAQQYWGAVYADINTGIAGGSYNARTNKQANNLALESCNEKHKGKKNNCQYVHSFANGCISTYWAPNKKIGFGVDGMYTQNARARAAKSCREKGGNSCVEILTFCTTRLY